MFKMNEDIVQFEKAAGVVPPEAYYHSATKEHLVQDVRGNWQAFTEAQVRRLLKARGMAAKCHQGELISQQEAFFLKMELENNVSYAGPLAGWKKGFHEDGGTRMLITSSPQIIEPASGDWGTLKALIEGLLGDRDGEQLAHFYGWVKIAYEALRAGELRPGQVLALCGPRACGKSLIQSILTLIFGGRMARPYQVMVGETSFNSDLGGAEHLVVEDEAPSTDMRARRAFGSQIKTICANDVQRLHGKYKDALVLRPFWRMSVSLNDEPENLLIIPPLDEALQDKVILLKATKRAMPMPTHSLEERSAFWSKLVSELPAFIDMLMHWEIPAELRCERFGVVAYHHPELLAALDAMAPEMRLLALIDSTLFPRSEGPVVVRRTDIKMTAEGIESAITAQSCSCSFEARRLLAWSCACGTYLARLAKKFPDRVQRARTASERLWVIKAPERAAVLPANDVVGRCLSFFEEKKETDGVRSGESSGTPSSPAA